MKEAQNYLNEQVSAYSHPSSRDSDKRCIKALERFGITTREQEVLHCLLQGAENKAIADHLQISTKTVDAHMRNVISKLSAKNRTHAVAIYCFYFVKAN
jgi:DNA-binding NarL/FixJ family response regulator